MKKDIIRIFFFGIILSVFACEFNHRDDFLLRNPTTGEEVVCYSGIYNFDEGLPQMRIAENCIHACERYGYRLFTGNPYRDEPRPQDPDLSLKDDIPPQCLQKTKGEYGRFTGNK